jgi:hypothetical protein
MHACRGEFQCGRTHRHDVCARCQQRSCRPCQLTERSEWHGLGARRHNVADLVAAVLRVRGVQVVSTQGSEQRARCRAPGRQHADARAQRAGPNTHKSTHTCHARTHAHLEAREAAHEQERPHHRQNDARPHDGLAGGHLCEAGDGDRGGGGGGVAATSSRHGQASRARRMRGGGPSRASRALIHARWVMRARRRGACTAAGHLHRAAAQHTALVAGRAGGLVWCAASSVRRHAAARGRRTCRHRACMPWGGWHAATPQQPSSNLRVAETHTENANVRCTHPPASPWCKIETVEGGVALTVSVGSPMLQPNWFWMVCLELQANGSVWLGLGAISALERCGECEM